MATAASENPPANSPLGLGAVDDDDADSEDDEDDGEEPPAVEGVTRGAAAAAAGAGVGAADGVAAAGAAGVAAAGVAAAPAGVGVGFAAVVLASSLETSEDVAFANDAAADGRFAGVTAGALPTAPREPAPSDGRAADAGEDEDDSLLPAAPAERPAPPINSASGTSCRR